MAAATIHIFALSQVDGAIRFVGNNDVGLKATWDFPSVSLQPNKSIDLLSDSWGEFELQGEVLVQEDGSFGTVTMTDGGTAPATSNYYIGKGIVYFQPDGTSGFVDLGNATKITFEPKVTKLDHYSSRTGVKTKDKSVITERSATLTLTLDEWTANNLAKAVLGTVS